jgi:hypothetical protein
VATSRPSSLRPAKSVSHSGNPSESVMTTVLRSDSVGGSSNRLWWLLLLPLEVEAGRGTAPWVARMSTSCEREPSDASREVWERGGGRVS